MIYLILFSLQLQKITLAGEDAPIPMRDHLILVEDGFLGWDDAHVYHWDSQGNLLLKFGGKGNGPGEFGLVSLVQWDGTYYWCHDGIDLQSSVFDKQGHFLFKQALYLRWINEAGGHYFAVDISRLNMEMVRAARGHPPLLREFQYHIDVTQHRIDLQYEGPPFRKASTKQATWGNFNFKVHLMVPYQKGWYIANLVENKLWFYDEQAIQQEALLADDVASNVPSKTLRLRHWSSADDWKWNQKWFDAQCRLNYLGRDEHSLYVGYISPDPNGQDRIQRLEVFDLTLGPSKQQSVLPGEIIAVKAGIQISWTLNEDGQAEIIQTPLVPMKHQPSLEEVK